MSYVFPLICASSDVHPEPVPAMVLGTVRAPWWEPVRTIPTAYCRGCADTLSRLGLFDPEEP
jgi:hypothetical protein